MSNIPSTKAPHLTHPEKEYDEQQQLQLTNHFRLYFNHVDGTNKQVTTNLALLVVLNWIGDN